MPIPLFSSAQARDLDVQSAKAQGIASAELMERAGRAAANLALSRWPIADRFIVLCGPGNNGGDGYVCARYLLQAGRVVQLFAEAAPNSKSPDAANNVKRWAELGTILPLAQFLELQCSSPSDVIIDALFGIGLSAPLSPPYAAAIAHANQQACGKLALDVPSGLNADTGALTGKAAFQADCTLSFVVHKAGPHTGKARVYVGDCVLDDLRLPAALLQGAVPEAQLCGAADIALPSRAADSHKGKNGHVLVLGGEHGMGGAVLLSGEAALYAGAGLISIGTKALHVAPLLVRCPEVMGFDADDAAMLAKRIALASVLALGPGFGSAADFAERLMRQLVHDPKPKVLDADALNWLAANSSQTAFDECCVLTPHPGEAARLLNCTVLDIERDRFAALSALVARYRCIVVLKGAGTLIGAPKQTPVVCGLGNPGMAAGGMGDVLTGCIAALMAQAPALGLSYFQACVKAVLAHSHAADALAERVGQSGLRASELGPGIRLALNGSAGAASL
jgi:ADP-dependent NAD(P)H-hydrate dehydratase / NAD(P)H-hydrate epimerase